MEIREYGVIAFGILAIFFVIALCISSSESDKRTAKLLREINREIENARKKRK